MNVWTHNSFSGFWPVGTAAVVVADTREDALRILQAELALRGLLEKVDPAGFRLLDMDTPGAVVLCDGDY